MYKLLYYELTIYRHQISELEQKLQVLQSENAILRKTIDKQNIADGPNHINRKSLSFLQKI